MAITFLNRKKFPDRANLGADNQTNPMDLGSPNPIDFGPILADIPGEIKIDDLRLDALVQAISAATIAPVERPLSPSAIPGQGGAGRVISIKPPANLHEGADYSGYSIPIPVDAFVTAPAITDWCNARGDDMKGGMRSSDVVRKYARLTAKTAPPIQHVTGDGAHRLCAAKRRGDEHILSRNVKIIALGSEASPVI